MTYSDILRLYSASSRRIAALGYLEPPIAYTNGYYLLAVDNPLCEWDPVKSRPARLSDPYHAVATVEVGRYRYKYRVCASCARLPELRAAARVTKADK